MSDSNEDFTEEVEQIDEVDEPQKRPRGRPWKHPIEENPEKKPRGRPRIENPCTPGHPKLGKQYYKNYYNEKLKGAEIPCPRCGVMYSKVNLTNHKRTNKCVRNVQINDLKSQLALLNETLNAMWRII